MVLHTMRTRSDYSPPVPPHSLPRPRPPSAPLSPPLQRKSSVPTPSSTPLSHSASSSRSRTTSETPSSVVSAAGSETRANPCACCAPLAPETEARTSCTAADNRSTAHLTPPRASPSRSPV
ncbi:hypothetical protein KC19_VG265000 [Ceratodon purpureus]|uniref:Uncharacterized protein n=1 Tax=Ceratodon purpureus TaxID=3225 RepID=A0A8T0HTW5_CERPU|nr:hypothetical protein KC19_VG265000 [Ceratodon purpureus]